MNRIIELSENDYMALKEDGVQNHLALADKVIAHSVPYKGKTTQDEWIPVSERLPEENGEYLVTREAYIDRKNRNMIFVRDIAWFTTNYGLNNGFHKANTVIAWMPLPELYEEGGKE